SDRLHPVLRGDRSHVSTCFGRHLAALTLAGPRPRARRDQSPRAISDRQARPPSPDDRPRRPQHARDQGLRAGRLQAGRADATIRARAVRRVARRATDGHAGGPAARLAGFSAAADGPRDLSFRVALRDRLPFVELPLAAGEADLHLGVVAREVDAQRDERVSLLLYSPGQASPSTCLAGAGFLPGSCTTSSM